jgi:hypothetical protein
VETGAGALGAIGLTHPHSHRFSTAPPAADDWTERVRSLARDLRSGGADWVVALLHDGVDWWPDSASATSSIRTCADRLSATTAAWAGQVDLIIGGHTPAAWIGDLNGTPAGHPHIWATSTLVVDLPEPPARPTVRGVSPIPPRLPANPSRGVRAFEAAAERIVGQSHCTWLTRTGAQHYLPDLIADAIRSDTGADTAFVPPSKHGTQAPVDGAIAALHAGPVTELDLIRLFAATDDRAVVVELGPKDLHVIASAYAAAADPTARNADSLWWNWCRMPAGLSTGSNRPSTVAVMPSVVRMLSEWLDRELDAEPAGVGARAAVTRTLSRHPK